MTRDAFLQTLRRGLASLPPPERDDILADYAAYFDDARASGRTEETVATALGDPLRLARELRVEHGLGRWERRPSLGNLLVAVFALGGLAVVDIFVLMPLLLFLGLAVLAISIALLVLGLAGVGQLIGALPFGTAEPLTATLPRALTGIGLAAASIGGGALLLLCLRTGMDPLIRYARLHYRALKPVRSGL